MRIRRLRPLPASGRLVLSLICAVAATLAAGLAFLAGAVALGSTACGTALISLALGAVQWRAIRAARADGDADEVTIDLRNPVPRLSTNDPVTGLVNSVKVSTDGVSLELDNGKSLLLSRVTEISPKTNLASGG